MSGLFVVGSNGFWATNLARFEPDGTLNASFNAQIKVDSSGQGLELRPLPTDKLLAWGSFSKADGFTRNGIARLLDDGRVDLPFDANALMSDFGMNLITLASGDILFLRQRIASSPNNDLVRLLSDGNVDPEFNAELPIGYQARVIVARSDNSLWIGGQGPSNSWGQSLSVVRLQSDGRRDISFMSGEDLAGYGTNFVTGVLELPGGKVMIAGQFAEVQ